MNFSLYFLVALLFSLPLSAKSISEMSSYPRFCYLAATDEFAFKDFKSHPDYRAILEHVTPTQGSEYLKIIRDKYLFVLDALEECRKNDSIGNPYIHFFPGVGDFSPTTLRYMKVAGDLISTFSGLDGVNIIEIGGGYGGQCTVLSALARFAHYTLVDLPEPALLTRKYLDRLNVKNTTCYSTEDFQAEDTYDLVISNYAFSEISEDEQRVYVEKILNRSKCGYITYNFIGHLFGVNSLSLEQLLELLKKPHRKIELRPEQPATGVNNQIIIWYEKR